MPRGRFNAKAPPLPPDYEGWTNPACWGGTVFISPTAKKSYNAASQRCWKVWTDLKRKMTVEELLVYWRKHGYVK